MKKTGTGDGGPKTSVGLGRGEDDEVSKAVDAPALGVSFLRLLKFAGDTLAASRSLAFYLKTKGNGLQVNGRPCDKRRSYLHSILDDNKISGVFKAFD